MNAVHSPSENAETSPQTACTQCDLPVPEGLLRPGEEHQFCCHGCEMAYGLLHTLMTEDGEFCPVLPGQRVKDDSSPTYAEMDDPAFLQLYAQPLPQGLLSIDFFVEGVHCSTCVWLLEKLPSLVDGVVSARLQYARSLLQIVWDPQRQSLQRIAHFLHHLGYPPHSYRDQELAQQRLRQDRKMLIRIAIAGAIAGNVMLLAFALYSGMFSASMQESHRVFFRWLSMLLTLPAVTWAARPFFTHAWAALKTRTLHMDLPIAIGVAVGFLSGAWNTVRNHGEIYFDSVCVLIFLLLVGRWLQHRQQRRAQEATEVMFHLTPSRARRLEDGKAKEVPVEALQEGDIIEIRAGESIAADGEIVHGASQLDTSILTGESKPFKVAPGAQVHAGSVNLSGILHLRVATAGSETRIGQIMQTVRDASAQRAPIVKTADRLAGIFIAAVFGMALLTFLLWLWRQPSLAIEYTIALLIVTCPCALAMATPLAIAASLGRAAQRGILIKGGEALELLARPGQIWLDKTGTLTRGELSLVEWCGDETIQPLVQAAESHSSHPIALALCRDLPAPAQAPVVTCEQVQGKGIFAQVDAQSLVVGSLAFAAEHGLSLPDWAEKAAAAWQARALTPLVIGLDGEVVALAGMGDPLRPEAKEVLDLLAAQGWQVGILSGDTPQVVEAIAASLAIPPERCIGGADPETKREVVLRSAQEGTVVMIGDGVNDAAALAVAHVGISVHGGAEASLASADVYLSTPGLHAIQTLLDGAQRTLRVIQRNLVFSLLYNSVGATLAIMGLINPLIAAILMPISSITVVTHSFRAKTIGATPCPSSSSSSLLPSSSPASS